MMTGVNDWERRTFCTSGPLVYNDSSMSFLPRTACVTTGTSEFTLKSEMLRFSPLLVLIPCDFRGIGQSLL
jgi:hypothetical protein